MRSGRDPTHVVRGRSPGRPAPVFLEAHSRLEFTGKGINETPTRLILFLALLPLATLAEAGHPASSSSASSLNDGSFQARTGNAEEGTSGTLLDELPGVTATGKGVIVGIIDSGIDWRHPDFRDPADSLRSRILSIWDTNLYISMEEGPPPPGFGYGREWTRDEIEAALRGERRGPPRDPVLDHGTYVAGIAAGNGNADPRYRGMAPDAEIVVVTVDGVSTISEALRYIFEVAEREGLPAVVNFSGGLAWGYREENLEEVLGEQPGRALVAAAGNVGQQQHVRFDLEEETAYYTVFQTHEEVPPLWESEEVSGRKYRWLFAYYQGPGEAWIGTGLSGEEMVWRSSHELADLGGEPDGHPFLVEDPEYLLDSLVTAAGDTLGRAAWSGHHVRENIWLQIMVEDWMSERSDWRLAARGSGVLHVWVLPSAHSQVLNSRSIDGPYFQPKRQPLHPFLSLCVAGSDFGRRLCKPGAAGALRRSSGRRSDAVLIAGSFPGRPAETGPGCSQCSDRGAQRRLDETTAMASVREGAAPAPRPRSLRGPLPSTSSAFPGQPTARSGGPSPNRPHPTSSPGRPPTSTGGTANSTSPPFCRNPPQWSPRMPGKLFPRASPWRRTTRTRSTGARPFTYELPKPGAVELTLYDLLGQPVRRLVSEYQGAGSYRIAWDGADDVGNQVASGVYLYRLEAGVRRLSRRLLFVR